MDSEKGYTTYCYGMDDFMVCVGQNAESEFDRALRSLWEEKMQKKCFRYGLEDVETKRIPGRYGFVAQLNIKRAVHRRKPQFVSSVAMPFDPQKFHFGKVDEREIIFQLVPNHRNRGGAEVAETDYSKLNEGASGHLLLINVSPLEYCHSLLVPSIEKCQPQVLNLDGLFLAIETVLLSHNPALKVGFNSLGAFASVNHLHFHIYYLKETLHLQHAPVPRLSGECFELSNFPSEGFAFQLLDKDDIPTTAESVMKLIRYLQEEAVAHNIFITRGRSFEEATPTSEDAIFNAVRIFVWARGSLFGSKNDATFNAALCELAGHLPIKDRGYYDDVTEDDVKTILKGTCHAVHLKVRAEVQRLYSSKQ